MATQPPQMPIQPPEPLISTESAAPQRPSAASSSSGLPSDASNLINLQKDNIPGQNTIGTTPTPASYPPSQPEFEPDPTPPLSSTRDDPHTQNVNTQEDVQGSKKKKKKRRLKRSLPTGQTFIPNPDPDKPPTIYVPIEGEENSDEEAEYHCYELEELHSFASDDDGQPDVFP
ncbi:hypothetical protein PIB30_071461 [Stylosanthes scabra]|uniref:Uncharacterized protein n=1 Tax=Stylosanthes scabra TaxID=79078 RepID=A0ABU6QQZ5_9FABA|nr:hypothetical protein [Stylosanthes scabra]